MVGRAENCIGMHSKGLIHAGEPSSSRRFWRQRVGSIRLPASENNKIISGGGASVCLIMGDVLPVELPLNAGHVEPRHSSSLSHQRAVGLGKATSGHVHQNHTEDSREFKLTIHNGSNNKNNVSRSNVCYNQQEICLSSSYKMKKNSSKRKLDKILGKHQIHYNELDRFVSGISSRAFPQFGNNPLAMFLCLSMMIIILANITPVAEAVDCFKCSSRNGSNPACEDPFHNLNTTRITSPVLPDPPPNVIYHTPCYAGRKGRDGLFPASACIKLTGIFDATGETLVVRHCALDSGTLTQDTELARMSHCGKFNFDGDSLKGCVLACPEDACNSVSPGALRREAPLVTVSVLVLAVTTLIIKLVQSG